MTDIVERVAKIICCGEGGCVLDEADCECIGDAQSASGGGADAVRLARAAIAAIASHIETTEAGVIDWKQEAERANRLWAEAEQRVADMQSDAAIAAMRQKPDLNLIRQALARAYCHFKNAHKELDFDLIESMTREIAALAQQEDKP
jgi:hypothetical protein